MFGYLKPVGYGIAEQTKRYYRQQYCTLCHALWTYYGFSPRFLLSFDMAFIACLFDLATSEQGKISCYKKMTIDSEEWKKLSALSLFMVEGKLVDDVCDSQSKVSQLILKLYKKPFAQAAADYPQTHDAIMQGFEKFRELEKQKADVTTLADAFAVIMCDSAKDLFTCTAVVEDVIFHVARWVYFIDAVDDLEEDLRKGRFNPFAEKAKTRKELVADNREEFMAFTQYTTQHLRTSIKEIDTTKRSSALVLAVLNLTIPNTTMQVLLNGKKHNKKRYVRLMEGRNVNYE